MKKKKILFVENDNTLPYLLKSNYKIKSPTGGASIELEVIIKELIKNHIHELGLISWKGSKAFIGNDLANTIEIFEASTLGKPHRIAYMIHSLISVLSYKPDYIFIKGNGLKIPFFMLCAKSIKCKTIFRLSTDLQTDGAFINYNNIFKGYLNKFSRTLYFFGLKNMDFILCQNTFQYNKLAKLANHNSVTHIVNDFIDINTNSTNSKKNRDYIAWIGRIAQIKNIKCLLDVAQKCTDITFKIAGGHQNEEIVSSLEKLKNVELVGHLQRDEIYDFISSAKGVLITSFKEGFSRVILEALVAGTPLILTRDVDPDDIIKNNDLGIVKEKHDQLSEGVYELINLKNYDNMSHRCIEYVKANHNVHSGVSKILSILN